MFRLLSGTNRATVIAHQVVFNPGWPRCNFPVGLMLGRYIQVSIRIRAVTRILYAPYDPEVSWPVTPFRTSMHGEPSFDDYVFPRLGDYILRLRYVRFC